MLTSAALNSVMQLACRLLSAKGSWAFSACTILSVSPEHNSSMQFQVCSAFDAGGPNRDAHPEHLAGQVDLAGLLDTSAALPEVSICGIHADKSPSDAGSHSNSAPGFGDNQAEIDQVSSVERIAKAAARNRRGDAAQP